MINLKTLSNTELDQNLKSLITKEKKTLKSIILHIAEIDLRKLYLEYAYPSLRAYLEDRMHYDGGSAQRRIDAARLSQQVPSVVESLDNGEIKLSQVTILQRSLREVKKQNITKEMKADLVESIKNKSVYESQSLISKALNIAIKQGSKVSFQADESVRLEMSLTKSQWEKIEKMRELLSHSVPSGEWDQTLEYLADKVIIQKEGRTTKSSVQKHIKVNAKNKTPSPAEFSTENSIQSKTKNPAKSSPKNNIQNKTQSPTESIPKNKTQNGETTSQPLSLYKLKKLVLKRDQCCQFKASGKICKSRWDLQADHIIPKWAGGKDTLENLRALCGNHNRYRYRKQAGIRRV